MKIRPDLLLRQHGWIAAGFLLVAIVAVTMQAGAPHIPYGFHSWPVALMEGDRLVQSVTPPFGGIASMSLQIERVQGDGSLVIEWAAERASRSEILESHTIPFRDLPTRGSWTIDVDRPVAGPEQPIRLQLSMRVAGNGGTVAFWVTEGHLYRGGNLSLNGRALPGDLVLNTSAPGARVWRRIARAFAGKGGGLVAALMGLSYMALVCFLISDWDGSAEA